MGEKQRRSQGDAPMRFNRGKDALHCATRGRWEKNAVRKRQHQPREIGCNNGRCRLAARNFLDSLALTSSKSDAISAAFGPGDQLLGKQEMHAAVGSSIVMLFDQTNVLGEQITYAILQTHGNFARLIRDPNLTSYPMAHVLVHRAKALPREAAPALGHLGQARPLHFVHEGRGIETENLFPRNDAKPLALHDAHKGKNLANHGEGRFLMSGAAADDRSDDPPCGHRWRKRLPHLPTDLAISIPVQRLSQQRPHAICDAFSSLPRRC